MLDVIINIANGVFKPILQMGARSSCWSCWHSWLYSLGKKFSSAKVIKLGITRPSVSVCYHRNVTELSHSLLQNSLKMLVFNWTPGNVDLGSTCYVTWGSYRHFTSCSSYWNCQRCDAYSKYTWRLRYLRYLRHLSQIFDQMVRWQWVLKEFHSLSRLPCSC